MEEGKISLLEFRKHLSSDKTCRECLFSLKWPHGYRCRKCGIERYKRAEETIQKSQQFPQAVFSILITNTALVHVITYERRSQLCSSHRYHHSGQDLSAAFNQI